MTAELITQGCAYSYNRQEERFEIIQRMLVRVWNFNEMEDHMEWTTIVSVMIAPPGILMDKFKPYIFVSFDYQPSRDERAVVRISERYYTSHFKELISLN